VWFSEKETIRVRADTDVLLVSEHALAIFRLMAAVKRARLMAAIVTSGRDARLELRTRHPSQVLEPQRWRDAGAQTDRREWYAAVFLNRAANGNTQIGRPLARELSQGSLRAHVLAHGTAKLIKTMCTRTAREKLRSQKRWAIGLEADGEEQLLPKLIKATCPRTVQKKLRSHRDEW